MQGLRYAVDIVMCIDATGSMTPVLDLVKGHALSFRDDVAKSLQRKGKAVDSIRVRVIAFRDFLADPKTALEESEFFELPDREDDFASFVCDLEPSGGGDNGGESGLEALARAMQSKWTTAGDRRRQIIVLWTDDHAHPLEKSRGIGRGYPSGMPKDFGGLTDLWDGQGGPMVLSAKRLILYAPAATPWDTIQNEWENVIHYPSIAGHGLAEQEYASIVDVIANSV